MRLKPGTAAVAMTFLTQPHRTEAERQGLIAELRRLRRSGLNVDRQEVIVAELQSGWELGWPTNKGEDDGIPIQG